MLGKILGGFKVQNVPRCHQKERNEKEKENSNTQICSREGEIKKIIIIIKKSKDKDKQWSHTTGNNHKEKILKIYGDGKNCWEGI